MRERPEGLILMEDRSGIISSSEDQLKGTQGPYTTTHVDVSLRDALLCRHQKYPKYNSELQIQLVDQLSLVRDTGTQPSKFIYNGN